MKKLKKDVLKGVAISFLGRLFYELSKWLVLTYFIGK